MMRNFIVSTCAPNIRWARNVAHVGEIRYLYKILVGKSEGINLLKHSHRLEDNIKTNLS
jgi:hypothetical protein